MATIIYLGSSDTIDGTGVNSKVGIGTNAPASKLTVAGDVEVTPTSAGYILKDSQGHRYRIVVSTSGVLSAVSI
jgi:hypothetical protein